MSNPAKRGQIIYCLFLAKMLKLILEIYPVVKIRLLPGSNIKLILVEFLLPGMEKDKYQFLGYKTFIIFTLRRSKLFFIFWILAVIALLIANNLSGNFSLIFKIFSEISSIGFLLAFIAILIALFFAWLEYSNYKFLLDENALKIRRGLIPKEEIAIPYRQIQNVNIKRSFFDQIIGVSKLIILTAGHEDKEEKIKTESEGILPAIDNKLAYKIQDELIKRANIEQVIIK
jgi:membrane protein YdbS with pleckstrin-like domain